MDHAAVRVRRRDFLVNTLAFIFNWIFLKFHKNIGYVKVMTPIENGHDLIKDGRTAAILDRENVKFLKMIRFWLQGIP